MLIPNLSRTRPIHRGCSGVPPKVVLHPHKQTPSFLNQGGRKWSFIHKVTPSFLNQKGHPMNQPRLKTCRFQLLLIASRLGSQLFSRLGEPNARLPGVERHSRPKRPKRRMRLGRLVSARKDGAWVMFQMRNAATSGMPPWGFSRRSSWENRMTFARSPRNRATTESSACGLLFFPLSRSVLIAHTPDS